MRQGRFDHTHNAFGMLGIEVTTEQIERSARVVDEQERAARKNKWSRGVRRALAVVCVFFVIQQITRLAVPAVRAFRGHEPTPPAAACSLRRH